MTECNKCGKCCEALVFQYNMEEIKTQLATMYPDDDGINFAISHFTEITKDEAYSINSHLKRWEDREAPLFFFTCNMYDKEKNICKDHKNRPPICSGYPWYNKEVKLVGQFPEIEFYDAFILNKLSGAVKAKYWGNHFEIET